MKNSSQQEVYSITLSDDILLDANTLTINVDPADLSYYNNTMVGDSLTITGGGVDTISIDSDYNTQYEIDFGDEWRTHFPDYYKVEEMCKHYPALEKALENFKTIYEMVKDDYDSKTRDNNQ